MTMASEAVSHARSRRVRGRTSGESGCGSAFMRLRSLLVHRKRLQAGRAMRLAACRSDLHARQAKTVLDAGALGLEHPAGKAREAALHIELRQPCPVEPELRRGLAGELL